MYRHSCIYYIIFSIVPCIILGGCASPPVRPTSQQIITIEWKDAFSKKYSISGTYYPTNIDKSPLVVISGSFYEQTHWEKNGYIRWLTNNNTLSLDDAEIQQSIFPAFQDGLSFAVFTFSLFGNGHDSDPVYFLNGYSASLEKALELPGIDNKSVIIIDIGYQYGYDVCRKIKDACDGLLLIFPMHADSIDYLPYSMMNKPLWCVGKVSDYTSQACAPSQSVNNYIDAEEFMNTQLPNTVFNFLEEVVESSESE